MTQFQNKSFSVQMGGRAEECCKHEWPDPKGHCVMCGVWVVRVKYTVTAADVEAMGHPKSFLEEATKVLAKRMAEQYAPNPVLCEQIARYCDEGE